MPPDTEPLESVDWASLAHQYFDALPSVLNQALSNAVYSQMFELANATKFGGHVEPHEVALFHKEFRELGLEPEVYLHTLKELALHSFRYHDRPPTMDEIKRLQEKSPAERMKHYQDLPDNNYPDIPAGKMVEGLQAAREFSLRHLERLPYKHEVAHFTAANANAGYIDSHYAGFKERQEQYERQNTTGGQPGEPGAALPGPQDTQQQAQNPGVGR